jgi:hypothetical protein
VQGKSGNSIEPDPENRVGDQDIGETGTAVASGLQVKMSQLWHCFARTGQPLEIREAYFI